MSYDRVLDFNQFVMDWARGMYRGLRYGQAFCNAFGIEDPELYYETDAQKSADMIAKYVKD